MTEVLTWVSEFAGGAIYQYLKDVSAPTDLILTALNPLNKYLDEATEASAPKSRAFTAGRAFGDGVAILSGFLEFLGGDALGAGGGALCLTGIGCLAGAPAVVGGIAMAGSGLVTTDVSLKRLIEHLHVLFSKADEASRDEQQNFPNPESNRPAGKPPENSVHDKVYTEKRHLENGSIAQRDLRKGKEAHVFNEPTELEALENKVWTEGVYQGQRKGEIWHRWIYRSNTPIGKRIQQGRPDSDLYIVEIKGRYRADGKFEYHLVPRSKSGVPEVD